MNKINPAEIINKVSSNEIFYIPNCGNAGDAAIALGTYNFFQKNKPFLFSIKQHHK